MCVLEEEDGPVTIAEAEWMVEGLSQDIGGLDPFDPRHETVGHALYLWRRVLSDIQAGNAVTERPTGGLDTI